MIGGGFMKHIHTRTNTFSKFCTRRTHHHRDRAKARVSAISLLFLYITIRFLIQKRSQAAYCERGADEPFCVGFEARPPRFRFVGRLHVVQLLEPRNLLWIDFP